MDKAIQNRLSSLGIADPILVDNKNSKILKFVDFGNNLLGIDVINEDGEKIGYIHEYNVTYNSSGCKWEIVVTGEIPNMDINIRKVKVGGMLLWGICRFEFRKDISNVGVVTIGGYFKNPPEKI